MKKKVFLDFFFILFIFFVDRFSKILIVNFNKSNEANEIVISSFLKLSLIWNEGIAFGLLSFSEKTYYNFLTVIIILITIFVLIMALKTKGFEKLGFMMILGGSTGNIFDRLYYSAVPDFIDFHLHNFHWFIFNVADIFITLGVILLVTTEIFLKKKL